MLIRNVVPYFWVNKTVKYFLPQFPMKYKVSKNSADLYLLYVFKAIESFDCLEYESQRGKKNRNGIYVEIPREIFGCIPGGVSGRIVEEFTYMDEIQVEYLKKLLDE